MYRGKPWTMRMFAGFGTPEDTNQRFKFLLANGQTGLSTAFDMPTLMGYDPDHARSLGEVGREGVAVASLDDMMRLFDDIPLDKVSTSMTINAPAVVLLALYIAVAEKQGVSPDKLRGTLQNDMLKEFIAQKEWISPDPRPHADHPRHARVVHADDAAVEHDLDQRLSHPRSRGDRRSRSSRSRSPTASATSQLGIDARPRRRRVRAAAVVLLGRPQRLLRGDREVPRRPPHVGARSCASASARRTRSRGCFARTRRPRACR